MDYILSARIQLEFIHMYILYTSIHKTRNEIQDHKNKISYINAMMITRPVYSSAFLAVSTSATAVFSSDITFAVITSVDGSSSGVGSMISAVISSSAGPLLVSRAVAVSAGSWAAVFRKVELGGPSSSDGSTPTAAVFKKTELDGFSSSDCPIEGMVAAVLTFRVGLP